MPSLDDIRPYLLMWLVGAIWTHGRGWEALRIKSRYKKMGLDMLPETILKCLIAWPYMLLKSLLFYLVLDRSSSAKPTTRLIAVLHPESMKILDFRILTDEFQELDSSIVQVTLISNYSQDFNEGRKAVLRELADYPDRKGLQSIYDKVK